MADMVVSFVVQETLSRICTTVNEEIKLIMDLGPEIERLQESLETVYDMLQEAEKKQVELKSVKRWLKQLKDAAYDAEDVLDELACKNLRQKVEKQNLQQEMEVRKCFSFS